MGFFDDLFCNNNSSNGDKWEFYKDSRGKWRWKRIGKNGRIVGASSQGYVNKSDCIENARKHGYQG